MFIDHLGEEEEIGLETEMKGDSKEITVSFISTYDLEKKNPITITIIVVYFALTTMSSVGFGDYHPTNTWEAGFCILIFLIVLFVWPLLVGKLMDSFDLLQNAFADHNPNNELAQFFGMLEHFNRNLPLNKELINSIEEYFKAYW